MCVIYEGGKYKGKLAERNLSAKKKRGGLLSNHRFKFVFRDFVEV